MCLAERSAFGAHCIHAAKRLIDMPFTGLVPA